MRPGRRPGRGKLGDGVHGVGANAESFHLAHPVERHRNGDRVQPGGEGRFAAELLEPLERTDERLLGEISREVAVAGYPMHQPVDPVHVRVVQLPLGGTITAETTSDELTIHGARIRSDNLRQGGAHECLKVRR